MPGLLHCTLLNFLCKIFPKISESTATARISHLRTKDARTHIIHTPGSDESRTQKHRRHNRDRCFSYAFKSRIAPASLSSARFNTRHTSGTDVTLVDTLYVSWRFSSTNSVGGVGMKPSAIRVVWRNRQNYSLLHLSFFLCFLYLL